MTTSQKAPQARSNHHWPPTKRPKLGQGVFLLRGGPLPQTKDTWELALIQKTRRLKLNEPLPEGPVILRDNLQYGRPFRLNYTSAQTIAWCDGQRTVSELEQLTVERLGWTPEQAHQSVQKVLDFLDRHGMLDDRRRRLRWGTFYLNPLRLARGLRYIIGYHVFRRYR